MHELHDRVRKGKRRLAPTRANGYTRAGLNTKGRDYGIDVLYSTYCITRLEHYNMFSTEAG